MRATRQSLVIALAASAILAAVVLTRWPAREARASVGPPGLPAARETVALQAVTQMSELTSEESERARPPQATTSAPPILQLAGNSDFLPSELAGLPISLPKLLADFDAASPAKRVFVGRDLLAQSIAIIQCATGVGPLAKGSPEEMNLFFGQDGKWCFRLNDRTFHFLDYEFPEYPEITALVRAASRAEAPGTATVELPADMEERIRNRAYEAIAWL